MKKILLMTLLVVYAMTSPVLAWAEDGEGSGWGKITEIYVDAQGLVLKLEFSGKIVNPSGCEGMGFYVRELDDSIASDRFLRVVMAAHMAGRKVKFWIEGCSRSKWWGKTRPQIFDIYIAD